MALNYHSNIHKTKKNKKREIFSWQKFLKTFTILIRLCRALQNYRKITQLPLYIHTAQIAWKNHFIMSELKKVTTWKNSSTLLSQCDNQLCTNYATLKLFSIFWYHIKVPYSLTSNCSFSLMSISRFKLFKVICHFGIIAWMGNYWNYINSFFFLPWQTATVEKYKKKITLFSIFWQYTSIKRLPHFIFFLFCLFKISSPFIWAEFCFCYGNSLIY